MRSCKMAMFWTVIRRPAIRGFPPLDARVGVFGHVPE
jgi:hypothetical protein